MTRAVTLDFEDVAIVADMVADFIKPCWLGGQQKAALGRLADALDEAEAREPSGLFPEPVIIGPQGESHPIRRAE